VLDKIDKLLERAASADIAELMSIFARDDDDLAHRIGALECGNGMRDHWFVRDRRQQFVEAHPLAAAGGDDDGS